MKTSKQPQIFFYPGFLSPVEGRLVFYHCNSPSTSCEMLPASYTSMHRDLSPRGMDQGEVISSGNEGERQGEG